jgi:hypothetical protein
MGALDQTGVPLEGDPVRRSIAMGVLTEYSRYHHGEPNHQGKTNRLLEYCRKRGTCTTIKRIILSVDKKIRASQKEDLCYPLPLFY